MSKRLPDTAKAPITREMSEALKKASEAKGISESEWIRRALARALSDNGYVTGDVLISEETELHHLIHTIHQRDLGSWEAIRLHAQEADRLLSGRAPGEAIAEKPRKGKKRRPPQTSTPQPARGDRDGP